MKQIFDGVTTIDSFYDILPQMRDRRGGAGNQSTDHGSSTPIPEKQNQERSKQKNKLM